MVQKNNDKNGTEKMVLEAIKPCPRAGPKHFFAPGTRSPTLVTMNKPGCCFQAATRMSARFYRSRTPAAIGCGYKARYPPPAPFCSMFRQRYGKQGCRCHLPSARPMETTSRLLQMHHRRANWFMCCNSRIAIGYTNQRRSPHCPSNLGEHHSRYAYKRRG